MRGGLDAGHGASSSPSSARNGRPLLAVDDVVGVDLVGDRLLRGGVRPAPSTATTVTSVSPIISAAAVEAVRPGLRTAFAPASSPATPPMRRAGQPTTRASGLTSRGASSAMPANRPSTPPTSSSATAAPLTPPRRCRAAMAASDDAEHADAGLARVPGQARRAAGSSPRAPPRSAARGWPGAPGRMLAISVIAVPSRSDTTTVRLANTVEAFGSSTPKRARTARPCPSRSRARAPAR